MKGDTSIGKRIAGLRTLKKIEPADLAQRSGLSLHQIDQIETAQSIPSLGTLIHISRALGIRLGTLLDDSDKTGPAVVRAGERVASASFSTSDESVREHMDFFSLAHNKAGRHMEPFIIDIRPSENITLHKSSHEGEEFIFVLNGQIKVAYGNDNYTLSQGDSIYLDSIVDHLITAAGTDAKVLAVVYVPV
ncbi:MAG: cupin domain-containing protein [Breznakibacter sp.]